MNILIAIVCFLAAFAALAAINSLELIPWKKSKGRLWTDRARILWPARKTQALLLIYLPLLIAAACSFFRPFHWPHFLVWWFAAFAGSTAAGWFFARQLFPHLQLRQWFHQVICNWTLRFGYWGILTAVGASMPGHFNMWTWLILAGMVILLGLWFTFSIHLLRLFGILIPPGERLEKIVASCIQNGEAKVRSLWQARMVEANAFAMPLSGTLIFSDSLLEILDDEEVAAICSHELGHLTESKGVICLRYLGAMAIVLLLLVKPAYLQGNSLAAIGVFFLYLLSVRLSRKLAHRMELRADSSASGQQANEGVYAGALEKIYRYNQIPAVMPEKNLVHPHLYDRMLAAGVTPEFPEPPVPQTFTSFGWLMLFAGPIILLWIYHSNGG